MEKSQRQLNKICFKDAVSEPCKNPIKIYKYCFDLSNININIHIFSISIFVAIYMKGKFQYQYWYQYFEIADFNININIDMTNILVFQYFSIYCPTSAALQSFANHHRAVTFYAFIIQFLWLLLFCWMLPETSKKYPGPKTFFCDVCKDFIIPFFVTFSSKQLPICIFISSLYIIEIFTAAIVKTLRGIAWEV